MQCPHLRTVCILAIPCAPDATVLNGPERTVTLSCPVVNDSVRSSRPSMKPIDSTFESQFGSLEIATVTDRPGAATAYHYTKKRGN